ncbi:unnamed protein product [Ambrosiozyma monospora]|uniref:Unnamed protein product n=1 Tax=Ambrosiozyma monospora TaxID=43982 RepID=A0ACB5U854_AMBMO|nr:unnamed protein product [Ambrosiozyma monospora]
MSLYFPAIRHIIKYLTVVCVLLTQVNAEDSPAPHVLAYSAGRGGYFEVAVPVDLAPFTIHAIPEDFEFDATMCYTSDESSSITDGTLGFASSRAAYVYTDDGSSKHDTIRVGFALNVPEEITEDIIAEFTIQPEDFGTAYFTVDATLNTEMLSYDDNLVTATFSTSSTSRAADFAILGETSTATSVTLSASPDITSPFVTMAVVAPSAVTFSEISYSAYGSSAKYHSNSAYFQGIINGTTESLSDPTIDYNNGLFDAFIQLTSSYDTINFVAYLDGDKSSYLAQLYASYLYLSVTDDETETFNRLAKRTERTFIDHTSFNTSTSVGHKTLSSTSLETFGSMIYW